MSMLTRPGGRQEHDARRLEEQCSRPSHAQ
jgi:hypothetical protein